MGAISATHGELLKGASIGQGYLTLSPQWVLSGSLSAYLQWKCFWQRRAASALWGAEEAERHEP